MSDRKMRQSILYTVQRRSKGKSPVYFRLGFVVGRARETIVISCLSPFTPILTISYPNEVQMDLGACNDRHKGGSGTEASIE